MRSFSPTSRTLGLASLLGSLVVSATVAATGCGSGDDGAGGATSEYPDTGLASDTGASPADSGSPEAAPDAAADAVSDTGDLPDAPAPTARTLPTNGGAIAITKDDTVSVAVNRLTGDVTIAKLDLGGATPLTKVADLDLGAGSEPWAVVIGNDDDTAFVVTRKGQEVRRITGLKSTPRLEVAKGKVGSEPTGLAISPTGQELYVANWSDGTVTVLRASDLSTIKTIDLNAALAGSGMLGAVASRPGLAHPRAVVVTNSGDGKDSDETLYVTEFFSQARTDALPDGDSKFDVARQGVVYAVKLADASVSLVTLAPVADTGFKDSAGNASGCFPNQLSAAALNNGRLYVTAVCESPRGPTGPVVAGGVTNPANFKTQIHAGIFAIDTATNKELPAQSLLLNKAFQKLYDDGAVPDDATRRMPLIPSDLAFAATTKVAYVTSYGSDAVFRVAYNDDGSLKEVGAATQKFINLGATGNLPVGIASANAGVSTKPFAITINETSRNFSVIALSTQTVAATVAASGTAVSDALVRGQKFFATGLGRWSFKGQGWNSCASCHPDGLTDNVTWYFARGPRQTTSLDGTYGDKKDTTKRRILNWTGIFDEVHDFELNTRGNSGGLGAVVWKTSAPPVVDDRIVFDGTAVAGAQKASATPQAGLNGSVASMVTGVTTTCAEGDATCNKSALKDWDEIDEYVKKIRAPRRPSNLEAAKVAAGEALFRANNCAACHGGSTWTISRVFYAPNEANNGVAGLLRTREYSLPAGFPASLNPAANNSGRKATLRWPDAATAGANDQIQCVLRDVGTFGVFASGVPFAEVRADMTTAAQGATGFNPPSLLGMVTGAPYFHGGNARTLEESFSATFDKHHKALATLFSPSATEVGQLVAFLSSIDNDATPVAVPVSGGITFDPDLCPKSFP